MGLSNEERFKYFFNNMRGWRNDLVRLSHVVDGENWKDIVRSWIKKVDYIVGLQITKLNSNSAYWLIGSNELSYQSLVLEQYSLAGNVAEYFKQDDEISFNSKGDYGSLQSLRYVNMADFASALEKDSWAKKDYLLPLAYWWVQWSWVDALLYPIYRYNDDLFKTEVKELFTELVGEISASRFNICGHDYHDNNDFNCSVYEQSLMAKYKVYFILLQEEENKINKKYKNHSTNKEVHKKYIKAIYKDHFDTKPLYETIRNLTIPEVLDLIEKDRKIKDDMVSDYKTKDYPKFKSVFGPQPRSKKELDDIVRNSKDYNEVEKASNDLEKYYSSYWNGWKDRFKNKSNKKGK